MNNDANPPLKKSGSEITRYSAMDEGLEPDPRGAWVKFEDHAKALSEATQRQEFFAAQDQELAECYAREDKLRDQLSEATAILRDIREGVGNQNAIEGVAELRLKLADAEARAQRISELEKHAKEQFDELAEAETYAEQLREALKNLREWECSDHRGAADVVLAKQPPQACVAARSEHCLGPSFPPTTSDDNIPAARHPDLWEYHIAPGGNGPHAATWADKPHRLIYDLTRMLAEEREGPRQGGSQE